MNSYSLPQYATLNGVLLASGSLSIGGSVALISMASRALFCNKKNNNKTAANRRDKRHAVMQRIMLALCVCDILTTAALMSQTYLCPQQSRQWTMGGRKPSNLLLGGVLAIDLSFGRVHLQCSLVHLLLVGCALFLDVGSLCSCRKAMVWLHFWLSQPHCRGCIFDPILQSSRLHRRVLAYQLQMPT